MIYDEDNAVMWVYRGVVLSSVTVYVHNQYRHACN